MQMNFKLLNVTCLLLSSSINAAVNASSLKNEFHLHSLWKSLDWTPTTMHINEADNLLEIQGIGNQKLSLQLEEIQIRDNTGSAFIGIVGNAEGVYLQLSREESGVGNFLKKLEKKIGSPYENMPSTESSDELPSISMHQSKRPLRISGSRVSNLHTLSIPGRYQVDENGFAIIPKDSLSTTSSSSTHSSSEESQDKEKVYPSNMDTRQDLLERLDKVLYEKYGNADKNLLTEASPEQAQIEQDIKEIEETMLDKGQLQILETFSTGALVKRLQTVIDEMPKFIDWYGVSIDYDRLENEKEQIQTTLNQRDQEASQEVTTPKLKAKVAELQELLDSVQDLSNETPPGSFSKIFNGYVRLLAQLQTRPSNSLFNQLYFVPELTESASIQDFVHQSDFLNYNLWMLESSGDEIFVPRMMQSFKDQLRECQEKILALELMRINELLKSTQDANNNEDQNENSAVINLSASDSGENDSSALPPLGYQRNALEIKLNELLSKGRISSLINRLFSHNPIPLQIETIQTLISQHDDALNLYPLKMTRSEIEDQIEQAEIDLTELRLGTLNVGEYTQIVELKEYLINAIESGEFQIASSSTSDDNHLISNLHVERGPFDDSHHSSLSSSQSSSLSSIERKKHTLALEAESSSSISESISSEEIPNSIWNYVRIPSFLSNNFSHNEPVIEEADSIVDSVDIDHSHSASESSSSSQSIPVQGKLKGFIDSLQIPSVYKFSSPSVVIPDSDHSKGGNEGIESDDSFDAKNTLNIDKISPIQGKSNDKVKTFYRTTLIDSIPRNDRIVRICRPLSVVTESIKLHGKETKSVKLVEAKVKDGSAMIAKQQNSIALRNRVEKKETRSIFDITIVGKKKSIIACNFTDLSNVNMADWLQFGTQILQLAALEYEKAYLIAIKYKSNHLVLQSVLPNAAHPRIAADHYQVLARVHKRLSPYLARDSRIEFVTSNFEEGEEAWMQAAKVLHEDDQLLIFDGHAIMLDDPIWQYPATNRRSNLTINNPPTILKTISIDMKSSGNPVTTYRQEKYELSIYTRDLEREDLIRSSVDTNEQCNLDGETLNCNQIRISSIINQYPAPN